MDYDLKLHGGVPSWDTTRESNERYQQLVRTGGILFATKIVMAVNIVRPQMPLLSERLTLILCQKC